MSSSKISFGISRATSSSSDESLKDSLFSTQISLDTQNQSNAEREAAISHGVDVLKALYDQIRKREQEITEYADKLTRQKNNLDIQISELNLQIETSDNEYNSNFPILNSSLNQIEQEYNFIIIKINNINEEIEQEKTKCFKLETMENELLQKHQELQDLIKNYLDSAPKRTPAKLLKEIKTMQLNLSAVSDRIEITEKTNIENEMKKIQLGIKEDQVEKSRLDAVFQTSYQKEKHTVKVNTFNTKVNSSQTLVQKLKEQQTKLIKQKEALTETCQSMKQTVANMNKSLRKTNDKREALFDLIVSKKRETKIAQQQTLETQAYSNRLKTKRHKIEEENAINLIQIREQSDKMHKKIGRKIARRNQLEKMLGEMKVELGEINKEIINQEEEEKHLNSNEQEIRKLRRQSQIDIEESRAQTIKDVDTLDQIQRKIAFELNEEKQLRYHRVDVITSPKVLISAHKVDLSELKQLLKQNQHENNCISYAISNLEAKAESNKQHMFLTKSEVDHAEDIYHFLKNQKLLLHTDALREKGASMRRSELDLEELKIQIRRKQNSILQKRYYLQSKMNSINSVMSNNGVYDYGANVALVVHKGEIEKDYCLPYIQVDQVLGVEKMEWILRKVKNEVSIWRDSVKPHTSRGMLETWMDQIDRFNHII